MEGTRGQLKAETDWHASSLSGLKIRGWLEGLTTYDAMV